ncbi:hypothetical protein Tco_0715255, partial [Tanacetum coccineum]
VPYYGTYGVCIGILACRGLSLVSSPLHAMKSQTQIQSSAAVKFGGVTVCVYTAEWPISSLQNGVDSHPNIYLPPHEDSSLIREALFYERTQPKT